MQIGNVKVSPAVDFKASRTEMELVLRLIPEEGGRGGALINAPASLIRREKKEGKRWL